MNSFNKLKAAALAAIILSGASVNATAGWEQAVGTVTGAALGNQIGRGNGKLIATVVGGVAGNEVGKAYETPNTGYRNSQYGYQVNADRNDNSVRAGVGTVIGGAVGAVLGNQVGGGNGKIIATVIGGIGGAMIGRSLATPKETVMRDAQGRQWTNGNLPMDTVTELPNFRRELRAAQNAYANYVNAASRASTAKNDVDWKRISESDYSRSRYTVQDAAYQFNDARSRMNDIASTAASKYDKHIEIDDLLIIASCNAVPVGNSDQVNFQQVMNEGRRCMPTSGNLAFR